MLVIQTAAPVAVFNFLLAEKHGRDSGEVSGLILVTHLGAVLYLLPLVTWSGFAVVEERLMITWAIASGAACPCGV